LIKVSKVIQSRALRDGLFLLTLMMDALRPNALIQYTDSHAFSFYGCCSIPISISHSLHTVKINGGMLHWAPVFIVWVKTAETLKLFWVFIFRWNLAWKITLS